MNAGATASGNWVPISEPRMCPLVQWRGSVLAAGRMALCKPQQVASSGPSALLPLPLPAAELTITTSAVATAVAEAKGILGSGLCPASPSGSRSGQPASASAADAGAASYVARR